MFFCSSNAACEIRVRNAGVFGCDGRYFKTGEMDGVAYYTQRTNRSEDYVVVGYDDFVVRS